MYFKNHQEFRKIFFNAQWLMSDQLLRMVIGFIVGVWVARYLGPSDFGLLNFALAFIAMFSSLSSMGISGIVVREILQNPTQKDDLLGTSFGIQLLGGILCSILSIGTIVIVNRGDDQAIMLVMIMTLTLILQAVDSVDLWFQSRVQSKYSVMAKTFSFIIASLSKIILILTGANLVTFAWVVTLEAALRGIGLVFLYHRTGHRLLAWRMKRKIAKDLLTQSWPLIISGFGAVIYLKIDILMLRQISGDTATGIYSVAVQLSEVWYFIPVAIATSVFPSIIESKKAGVAIYHAKLQRIFNVVIPLSILLSIMISVLSKPIILLLYGDVFRESIPVLAIHIWASIFIFSGAILSKYLIAEGFIKFSMIRHGLGAIMNIVLNLVLIPQLGPIGAAIATLISYAAATYLSCFLHPGTKIVGKMITVAFLKPFKRMSETENAQ